MDLPDRSNNNHVDYVSFIYQRSIKVIELNYEPMSLRPWMRGRGGRMMTKMATLRN